MEGIPPNLDVGANFRKVCIRFSQAARAYEALLRPKFEAVEKADSVGSLLVELEEVHKSLEAYEIFEKSKSTLQSNEAGDIEIFFDTKIPRRPFSFGVNVNQLGAYVLEVEANQCGLLGKPHTLGVNGSIGGWHDTAFSAAWSIPRIFGLCKGVAQLTKSREDFSRYSSYISHDTQACFRLLSKHHVFAWSLSLRDVEPATEDKIPSQQIRLARHRSIKHAVKYSYTNDELIREREGIPVDGVVKQIAAEMTLGGGDVQHTKWEGSLFRAWSFLETITHLGVGAGYLTSTAGTASCLQDRFFLGGSCGGATALRGFRYRGVGPSAPSSLKSGDSFARDADMLGGNAFLSFNTAFHWRLPPSVWNFKAPIRPLAVLFLNGGQVAASPSQCYRMEKMRLATGMGLAAALPIGGWLEICLAWPFKSSRYDARSPVQLGIRFSHTPM